MQHLSGTVDSKRGSPRLPPAWHAIGNDPAHVAPLRSEQESSLWGQRPPTAESSGANLQCRFLGTGNRSCSGGASIACTLASPPRNFMPTQRADPVPRLPFKILAQTKTQLGPIPDRKATQSCFSQAHFVIFSVPRFP